ncbi:MAG: response regulator [Desulfobacteraceae bacterium]|jgi:CheY-like chemotaxis protein
MSPKSPLEDKIILVVDDEPDVLETVGEILDMCLLYKAKSYEEGIEYLRGYTIDIAILDIMGVNGFELLKRSVDKGIPTVMLTAHALTPEALKKSMKLGALTFLPKEKLSDLQEFLEDVVLGGGKAIWIKFFDRLGAYFDKRFGPDWKEKDEFFRDFEEAVRSEVGSEK